MKAVVNFWDWWSGNLRAPSGRHSAGRYCMKLIKRKEAAALLGLSPQTLAKWAMTGRNLSVIRIGNRAVRYSHNEIEEFIKSCTATNNGTNNQLNNGGRNDE